MPARKRLRPVRPARRWATTAATSSPSWSGPMSRSRTSRDRAGAGIVGSVGAVRLAVSSLRGRPLRALSSSERSRHGHARRAADPARYGQRTAHSWRRDRAGAGAASRLVLDLPVVRHPAQRARHDDVICEPPAGWESCDCRHCRRVVEQMTAPARKRRASSAGVLYVLPLAPRSRRVAKQGRRRAEKNGVGPRRRTQPRAPRPS